MRKLLQRLALVWIVMSALLGLHTLWSVWEEERRAETRLRETEATIERQRAENALLRERLETGSEQSELERIAREQLFLFYPNEKIFLNTGN